MSTANNGKHKDNNNIANYLESNKHSLLDLAEKNYENLVGALANNAIASAVASSNPTSSLQQSSSTFPNLFDQIDIFRKEDSEIYDNSKGDIAD